MSYVESNKIDYFHDSLENSYFKRIKMYALESLFFDELYRFEDIEITKLKLTWWAEIVL